MFTGMIEAMACIQKITPTILSLERPRLFTDIHKGSSICVSGICLSVVGFDDTTMTFDTVEETFRRTKFGSMHTGDRVNLERSLPLQGRFDGHIVQGHGVGVGNVVLHTSVLLTLSLPPDLLPFVAPKGSIALDGVSLTIASLEGDRVSVALIPHTLEHTTLGTLQKDDVVNIETDILARTLFHLASTGVLPRSS